MSGIIVRPGFLSRPECEELVKASHALAEKRAGGGQWAGRILYIGAIQAAYPMVALAMRDATARILGLLSIEHQLDRPLYPDTVHIARWVRGQSMGVHADRNAEFPHRAYSSVVYLTDCDGGALYFPRLEVRVQPEVGLMAAFSADVCHEHGVDVVASDERLTMPGFYTFDESKREHHPA